MDVDPSEICIGTFDKDGNFLKNEEISRMIYSFFFENEKEGKED